MCKKTGNYILKLEKEFEEKKKQNIPLLCLYCKNKIVSDVNNSNLCDDCKREFGHRYLREL